MLLLAVTFIAQANSTKNSDKEYSQSFEENFKVSGSSTLELRSDFSTVEILDWNQNEIEVLIKVSVDSKNENAAQNFLDKATVRISKDGNTVSVSTDFESNHNWKHGSFDIDITIRAPKDCRLELNHSFGGMTLGSFSGASDIDSEYGSITAKSLGSPNNNLEVSFGSANIDRFGGGFLSVEYGSAEIGHLLSECEIENSFSELEIDHLDLQNGEIEVDNSYGSITLGVSESQNFSFDTKASFGDIDLPKGVQYTKKEDDSFSSSRKGNKGNGGIHFKINTRFGGVEIEFED